MPPRLSLTSALSNVITAVMVTSGLMLVASGQSAASLKGGASVVSIEQIPEINEQTGDAYKSYALFLVCNPEWLSKERTRDLVNLFGGFLNLGRVIGSNNLSVWFTTEDVLILPKNPAGDFESLADITDVERAANICIRYNLPPSRGPYILASDRNPETKLLLNNYFAIGLNQLTANRINYLLARLADKIYDMIFNERI